MEKQKKELEISFSQLLKALKKSFIFVIIAALIGATMGIAYSVVIDKPAYKATASFWIDATSTVADYFNSNQFSAAAIFSTNCIELVDTDYVVRAAVRDGDLVEKLGITGDNPQENEDRCVKKVKSMVSASKRGDETAIFNVSATASTPDEAYEVMLAYQDILPKVIPQLLSIKTDTDRNDLITLIEPTSRNSVATVKSSPVTLGMLGAIAAAVLVYAVFFIFTLFDTAVYDENAIKDHFDYPIVGHIPSFGLTDEEKNMRKKKKKKIKNTSGAVIRNYENKLVNEDSPFFVTEAFNTLRTNLLYSALDETKPIFAVTSDVAGAGKTMVSANLAISFANLKKKVLLVECDMRCPSFSKVFGKKIESGTSELLAGMYPTTDEVVTNIGIDNLDVIFGGKIPPNPSELLSGHRMEELANEWRNKYDYIILDLPPIGEVFDAGVVSNVVNGYVLTVRCNHSDVSDIRESTARIQAVNGNLLGLVLNDIDPKSNKRYKIYYGNYEKTYK